jgi:hypothetical protein
MVKLAVVAAVVAVACFLGFKHRRAEAGEHRLAAIASVIAGRTVHVDCQGAFSAAFDVSAEAGSVEFGPDGRPADTTKLKRGTCSALARFGRDRARPEFACLTRRTACPDSVIRSAWSVQALSHEAWHLAGELDEARTQCFGLQTTAYVAQRLGADRAQAQALASYLYERIYPQMPSEYRSGHCRDGGALDLRPQTTVWP